jgi:hypothetical protein
MNHLLFPNKLRKLALASLVLAVFYSPLAAGASTYQTSASDTAIYKSTDSGVTWSAINQGLPCVSVKSVVVNPISADTLYLGTDRGVFKSIDGGQNWITPSGIITLGNFSPVIHPGNPATIYAAGTSINGAM